MLEDMAPVVLGIAIVLFLGYVCCSPSSAPGAEPKERPHSFGTTRAMLDAEKDD